jgi:hypothetical protein
MDSPLLLIASIIVFGLILMFIWDLSMFVYSEFYNTTMDVVGNLSTDSGIVVNTTLLTTMYQYSPQNMFSNSTTLMLTAFYALTIIAIVATIYALRERGEQQ